MPSIARWTGAAALAVAVLLLAESVTQLSIGPRPGLMAGDALAAYTARHAVAILSIVLIDTLLMVAFIVFLGGFRHFVVDARPDLEWIATTGYSAGIVWAGVTIVGDAMGGGAALDAIGGQPDPVVIRALTEGHSLMFGGIGCVLTAVVAFTAGYLTFETHLLPPWSGWIAYAAAILNLASVPTVFLGTDSEASPLATGGWANALLATFPWLLWVVLAGISLVRRERHEHPVPAGSGAAPDAPASPSTPRN